MFWVAVVQVAAATLAGGLLYAGGAPVGDVIYAGGVALAMAAYAWALRHER